MANVKEISVFVDESGSFAPNGVDACSPYYLLCMVFHDQSADIAEQLDALSVSLSQLGFPPNHAVHAGPLIRREDEYEQMPRQERIGVFRRMMAFIHNVDVRYRCFKVYKPYTTHQGAIHDELLQSLLEFLVSHREELNCYDEIKIYYDNGQSQVKELLKETFALFSSKTHFVSGVSPVNYRLFQVADVLCTIELVNVKLIESGRLSPSEDRFFGGVRNFKKLYVKPMLRKRWD